MEEKILNKLSKEGRERIIKIEGEIRELREEINYINNLLKDNKDIKFLKI